MAVQHRVVFAVGSLIERDRTGCGGCTKLQFRDVDRELSEVLLLLLALNGKGTTPSLPGRHQTTTPPQDRPDDDGGEDRDCVIQP